MIKINSFSLVVIASAALALSSCSREEDDLFSQSAIERVEEAEKAYTNTLESSPGGWVMEYYPTSATTEPQGDGYVLLAKFYNENGKKNWVTVGMQNAFTYDYYKEASSAWEIIADAGPVLSFNTYNECLHAFSDPNDLPFTSTSETGLGAEGDYEFIVVDMQDNQEFATLKGKKQGTYVRMTRLPEGTDFKEYLADLKTFKANTFPTTAPNFDVLTVGDSIMKVDGMSGSMTTLYAYNGDKVTTSSLHPYTITKRDGKYYLRFREPINGYNDVSEQEFVYDADNDLFTGVTNAANKLTGPNANDFVFVDDNEWQWVRNAQKSASMKTLTDNLYNGLRKKNQTFQSGSFTIKDSQVTLSLKTSTVTYVYIYDLVKNEDGSITLKYKEPGTTGSANSLESTAGLKEYVNAFNDTFKSEGTLTNFDLSSVKLISTADAEKWLVIKYSIKKQ